MFEKHVIAGCGDMDFNSHMRNTAYLDKSADVRMMYFGERGFPMSEFLRLKIGPVIMKDELEYFREVQLLEEFIVDLALAGLAGRHGAGHPDGALLRLRRPAGYLHDQRDGRRRVVVKRLQRTAR